MRRFVQSIGLVLALSLPALKSAAFSLLGPTPSWQTTAIGYDPANLPSDVSGGPMNLGQGYRWNTPTIYYSYTPAFLHYFGARGAAEIDKAIASLNNLPSMDSVNPLDFPTASQRINYQAAALGLFDLKSRALSETVHVLGLTDPTRYGFTLRDRFVIGLSTNYYVVRRNFSPATVTVTNADGTISTLETEFEPTSYINGQLWTYTTILDPVSPTIADALAVMEPVDPLAESGLINTPVTGNIANLLLQPGGFWTGLTRDDVGGLRYLYRSALMNVETPPPGSALLTPGTTTSLSSGGASTTSPWSIPTLPAGAAAGTGTGVTPATTANTNIVTTVLRPGIAKINFVKVDYNSLFGAFPSNTVGFVDRYVTNGIIQKQNAVRPLLSADIVFDAQDLLNGSATPLFLGTAINLGPAFQNNGAINGSTPLNGSNVDGPGQINPSGTAAPLITVIFNTAGPAFLNFAPSFISEANSSPVWRWGTFDGSTNTPIVYPNGSSITNIEQQVLSGQATGGIAGVSPLVSPWSSADQVLFPPGTTIPGLTGATGVGGGTGTGTGVGGGTGGTGGTGIGIIANTPP